MNCYIGIDPGKSGCLAVLTEDRDVLFFDWPKDNNVAGYIDKIEHALKDGNLVCQMAVLERVHAMPKQGVSSMFSFGMNFGMWQMWLYMKKLPHQTVPPQTWMKGFVQKGNGGNTKQRVGNACQSLFPNAELTGPQGGFKDGRADALMMAYYASKQIGAAEAPVKVKKANPRRRS